MTSAFNLKAELEKSKAIATLLSDIVNEISLEIQFSNASDITFAMRDDRLAAIAKIVGQGPDSDNHWAGGWRKFTFDIMSPIRHTFDGIMANVQMGKTDVFLRNTRSLTHTLLVRGNFDTPPAEVVKMFQIVISSFSPIVNYDNKVKVTIHKFGHAEWTTYFVPLEEVLCA